MPHYRPTLSLLSAVLAAAWFVARTDAQTTITFIDGQQSFTAYNTDDSGAPYTFSIAFGTGVQIGTVTGSTGLTIAAGGTIILGGAEDNTGLTATVNYGTLVLWKDSSSSVHAIGGGGTSLSIGGGGTVQIGGGSVGSNQDQIYDGASVQVNQSSYFDLNGRNEAINGLTGNGTVRNSVSNTTSILTVGANNGSSTFGGTILNYLGIVGLTKVGTGTFTLTGGGVQPYTGPTVVSAGGLALSGNAQLPSLTALTVAAGATFYLNGIDNTINALTGAGSVILDGGTLRVIGPASTTFAGTISKGTLAVEGKGALSGTTDNFQLSVRVDSSTFELAKTSSSTVHAVGIDLTIGSQGRGGTLRLAGTGDDQIYSGASVAVFGTGFFDLNGHNEGFDTLAGNGMVINNAAGTTSTLTLGEKNGNSTFGGKFWDGLGAVALTKTGTGTLTLTNSSVYTGPTTIAQGTLVIGSGLPDVLPNFTALTVAAGATFDLLNNDVTIGSLAGAGSVTLDPGGSLTVGDATSTTFSGVISGTGTFQKALSGSLVLTGVNTYTGNTIVAGGTLAIAGAGALPVATDLTVMHSGTFNANGGDVTIGSLSGDGAIVLGTGGRLTLGGNNTYSTTFSGVISGTGASLVKIGTGRFILADAADTYTGPTTISGGTLQIGDDNGIGMVAGDIVNHAALVFNGSRYTYGGAISGTGTVTIQGTAILKLTGNNTYTGGTILSAGNLELNALGTNLADTGAVTINGGEVFLSHAAETIGSLFGSPFGTLSINHNLTINQSVDGTFGGLVQGGGGLVKQSAGTLTLTGWNTYSGGTWLNAGTLALGSAYALGTYGTIHFGGGTLQFSPSNATNYSARFSTAAGQAYRFDTNGQSVTLITALTSSGGTLAKLGAGTLTLAGANTYDGDTTVSGSGTLKLSHALALQNSTLATGGTNLVFDSSVAGHAFTLGGLSGSANLALADSAANPVVLTVGNNNANTTFSGVLSGTGGALVKTGSGTLALSAANTYTGGTSVNTGTLKLTAGSSSSAFIIASGATLELASPSGTVNSSGTTFSGAGTLKKSGDGTSRWPGAATFALASGSLIDVQGGTLVGGYNGNEVWTNNKSNLNVAAGATFHGGEANVRVDALTGAGAISSGYSGAGYQNFTFGVDNGSGTFSGILADNSSYDGNYVKAGTGTQILTGVSTYTGATTISDGTLIVNGSIGGSALTTVASGATLGGSGTVGNLVVSGTLSPGNSPGTLSAGDTTWNGGATYLWELNSASDTAGAKGVTYDWLDITGTLTLAATGENPFIIALATTPGPLADFDATQDYSYTIATATGGILGLEAGSLTINAAGFANDLAGGLWSLEQMGNDLKLNFTAYSAVPEPATYAALAGLVCLAAALRRRLGARAAGPL